MLLDIVLLQCLMLGILPQCFFSMTYILVGLPQIYTHVMQQGANGVRSPFSDLPTSS